MYWLVALTENCQPGFVLFQCSEIKLTEPNFEALMDSRVLVQVLYP